MHAKLVSGLAAALASLAQARPSPSSNALEARDQQSNTVWCGPVLAAAAQSASAEWKVPSVSLPSPNNGPAPSFYQWVGIDGFGTKCNDALLQVGTSQVWNSKSNAFVYDVWLEYWTPQNQSSWHFGYPNIKAGDNVRATVVAKDTLSGTVTLENLSNQESYSWDLKATGNYPLCFEHVEWVNEAPNHSLPSFPDFSFTSLSYTDWNGNSYNAAGSDLVYLNQTNAVCSATLSNDGNTAYFTQALPN